MTVRRATEDDLPALGELWRAFLGEVPPPGHEDVDTEQELREIAEIVREEVAFVVDGRDGKPVGFALARRKSPRRGHLTDLYVSAEARRSGTATALVTAVAETLAADGVPHLTLDVQAGNALARAVYGRWGFRESMLELAAPVDVLLARLGRQRTGRTFGSIHVQTDDLAGIERAVRQFVPRLPGGSRGSIVAPPRNGWIAVYDDVCERDPRQLRRLARELGDRTGAVALALGVEEGAVARFILFERGRVVDEYLSVQEYYAAAARRRDRAGGEPARGCAADGRRSRRRARGGGARGLPRRAAAGRGACLRASRGRWASRVRATAGATRRRSTAPCGSSADGRAHALRRPALPVLRAHADHARGEAGGVRDGRGRPRRPAGLDLREEPEGPSARARHPEEAAGRCRSRPSSASTSKERYPEPPLWPADPEERAAARVHVFRFDDFSKPYYALRRGETGARERFDDELAALDHLLDATGWLSGGAFGLADIAYLPWVLRARDLLGVSFAEQPRVADWVERACERPSVAAEVEIVAAL